MPLSEDVPLVMPKLLTALREGRKNLPKLPPAMKHLESNRHVNTGDVMSALYDLMLRPEMEAVGYPPGTTVYEVKRDNGIAYQRQFEYLHNVYGRIAPIGFFWRFFVADVINGGHDQYCYNQLAGAEPKESSLALLIRLVKDLALDELPGGQVALKHLERVQIVCLELRDNLFEGYQDGVPEEVWDDLDQALYENISFDDDFCPAAVWDRHLNAKFRAIIMAADQSNQLAKLSAAWGSLPPPTEKQIYEIEAEQVSKAWVEDYMRREEKRRWWKFW